MVKQVSSFTVSPRAQVATPKPSSEAQFFTPNGDRVSIDLAAPPPEKQPEI